MLAVAEDGAVEEERKRSPLRQGEQEEQEEEEPQQRPRKRTGELPFVVEPPPRARYCDFWSRVQLRSERPMK